MSNLFFQPKVPWHTASLLHYSALFIAKNTWPINSMALMAFSKALLGRRCIIRRSLISVFVHNRSGLFLKWTWESWVPRWIIQLKGILLSPWPSFKEDMPQAVHLSYCKEGLSCLVQGKVFLCVTGISVSLLCKNKQTGLQLFCLNSPKLFRFHNFDKQLVSAAPITAVVSSWLPPRS